MRTTLRKLALLLLAVAAALALTAPAAEAQLVRSGSMIVSHGE